MKLCLTKDEAFLINGDARGLSVSCGHGRLWLTQPGDSRDHILSGGQELIISQKGKIAVIACEDSDIDFGGTNNVMRNLQHAHLSLLTR